MDDTTMTTMLGREVAPEEIGRLDTFPVDERVTSVVFEGDELQALCPAVPGIQPDLYQLRIAFEPAGRTVESKSLKLYLTRFRDERIFAEHLAARIATDVAAAVGTAVEVRLVQNRRGGLVETVTARAG